MHNEIKEQQSEREKGEKNRKHEQRSARRSLSRNGNQKKGNQQKTNENKWKNWNRELREQKKLNGKTSLDKRLIRLWSTHIYL